MRARDRYVALLIGAAHVVIVVHRLHWPVVVLDTLLLLSVIGMAALRRVSVSIALCFACVYMAMVGEPSLGAPALCFVFLIPMFFVIRAQRSRRHAFGYGMWVGGLSAAGIFSWLWAVMTLFYGLPQIVTFAVYVLVCSFMALQFGLFFLVTRWALDYVKWPLGLVGALVYAFMEYWLPNPFPIQVVLGAIWSPICFQIADLVGAAGTSLIIVLINGAFYELVSGVMSRKTRISLIALAAAVVLLAFEFGYGAWSLCRYAPKSDGSQVNVAMIQPMSPLKILNVDHETKLRVAKTLREMSEEAETSAPVKPDMLIWPEGAAPFAYTTPAFNPEFVQALRDFQTSHPVTMTFQDVEFVRGDEESRVRYYNHISLIAPDGTYLGGYRKNLPMPFTEYIPGEKWFPWLRALFPNARHVLSGEKQTVLPGPGGPFVPLICYEILDANFVRTFVRQGARYMINYTNDEYYGPVQQPWQHLAFAVLRAVENRRPLIRSTNSGISAIIDARGEIAPNARTGIMQRTILHGSVTPRTGDTLYTMWGDWLSRWVMTLLVLAGIVTVGLRNRRAAAARVQREIADKKSRRRRDRRKGR